jgi:hypothetical protein
MSVASRRPQRGLAGMKREGERALVRDWFAPLARAGLLARAIVYAVIGILAIDIASGSGSERANQQGALDAIASQTLGSVLLALVAAGLAAYATWRMARALIGHGREQVDTALERVAGAASAIVYGALCVLAIEILTRGSHGVSGGGAGRPSTAAAGVLGWPGGPVLVAIAGVVLCGVGFYQAYNAVARKFMQTARTSEMSAEVRRAYCALGVFGHLARAVVFAMTGYGAIRAAIDYDPRKAVGLDEALRHLARASYGPVLLGLVAAGLIAFSGYSAADARYRKV